MKLARSFETGEITPSNIQGYDIVFWHGPCDPTVESLLRDLDTQEGVKVYRYLNILTLPEPDWNDPLLNLIREYIPAIPGAKAWWMERGIAHYAALTTERSIILANRLNEVNPYFPWSFDLYFRSLEPWMFAPSGIQYENLPSETILGHPREIDFLIEQLDPDFGSMTNCTRSATRPRYYERCLPTDPPKAGPFDVVSTREDWPASVEWLLGFHTTAAKALTEATDEGYARFIRRRNAEIAARP